MKISRFITRDSRLALSIAAPGRFHIRRDTVVPHGIEPGKPQFRAARDRH